MYRSIFHLCESGMWMELVDAMLKGSKPMLAATSDEFPWKPKSNS